jgi:hypothetical protein
MRSPACASPLRSSAPSTPALPPSPPPPAGDVLESRPHGRAPQSPYSPAPDRGHSRPWSYAPRLPGALIAISAVFLAGVVSGYKQTPEPGKARFPGSRRGAGHGPATSRPSWPEMAQCWEMFVIERSEVVVHFARPNPC